MQWIFTVSRKPAAPLPPTCVFLSPRRHFFAHQLSVVHSSAFSSGRRKLISSVRVFIRTCPANSSLRTLPCGWWGCGQDAAVKGKVRHLCSCLLYLLYTLWLSYVRCARVLVDVFFMWVGRIGFECCCAEVYCNQLFYSQETVIPSFWWLPHPPHSSRAPLLPSPDSRLLNFSYFFLLSTTLDRTLICSVHV